MLTDNPDLADVLVGQLVEANARAAGLEAQIHEAALKIATASRLIDEAAKEHYTVKVSLERRELELVDARQERDDALTLADGWRKVADAKAEENAKLRRLIIASDDGVTPE